MDISSNSSPTFEDDLKQVLAEVPPPIRAFIASGKIQVVAKNLMQKNQLHIDQGAVIGRELVLLLLGINTPLEFTQTLAEEAKLDQRTVNGIVQDMNAQIFMPLREEMRRGAAATQQPTPTHGLPKGSQPVMPQPRPPVVPPRTAPNPLQPASHFHLQNKLPVRPAQSPTATTRPLQPTPPRPMDSSTLLEDHEEPHIEFHPPSPNLPGVIYHPPIPKPPTTKPLPNLSPKPIQTTTPTPPVKPYSSDPYREPIE